MVKADAVSQTREWQTEAEGQRGMRALVVGGTGPTGHFIVEGLLARGYRVTVFHRGVHEIPLSDEVEHVHGDPHFPETIEQALGRRSFDLTVATYGRLRHVALAMRTRTERLISVGGDGVYRAALVADPQTASVALKEEAPLQTDSDLDRFSYLMALSEKVVMDGHEQGCYLATHFRYPPVYGPYALAPREWCVIRRIIDGRHQIILPCGGLTLQSRVYAENAAYAILLAVDHRSESAGKIYNVSDDQVLTLREWVEALISVLGAHVEIMDMPYSWSRPSHVYMRWLRHRVVSNDKIRAELGYHDVVPTLEALKRTVAWLMDNQPERGGDVERAIGDCFDYASEDRIIEEYMKAQAKVMAIPVSEFVDRHPYPHPRKPAE